jgi:hypothetical protein
MTFKRQKLISKQKPKKKEIVCQKEYPNANSPMMGAANALFQKLNQGIECLMSSPDPINSYTNLAF